MSCNFSYEVITCRFLAKKMNKYLITLASMEDFYLIKKGKVQKQRKGLTKSGLFFLALLLYKHGQRSLEEFIRIPLIFYHMKNIS